MTKPAQLTATMELGGTSTLPCPNSDKDKDPSSHTNQSDITSTLFDLGVITQLDEGPCSCMLACSECLLSITLVSSTYKVRREGRGWRGVKGVT